MQWGFGVARGEAAAMEGGQREVQGPEGGQAAWRGVQGAWRGVQGPWRGVQASKGVQGVQGTLLCD